jgi:hypothetical protein
MVTVLRDRSVAGSASTRVAEAVPRRRTNDRRKAADSRRIDRIASRPSGSDSLRAGNDFPRGCASLAFFLPLSLCPSVPLSLCASPIDDYVSDLQPPASDRFADLEIEIGELFRGASTRDAACLTVQSSKLQLRSLRDARVAINAVGTAMCGGVISIEFNRSMR